MPYASTNHYRRNKTRDTITYFCKIRGCNYSTVYSKVNLRNHIYARHTEEKDRPYQCKYFGCNRGFSQNSHLKSHNEKIHGLLPDEEILWKPNNIANFYE